MSNKTKFVGFVQEGDFKQLDPPPIAGASVRFTSIKRQESQFPESGELDFTPYETMGIMIKGNHINDWIYNAEVIDKTGPITELIKKNFGLNPLINNPDSLPSGIYLIKGKVNEDELNRMSLLNAKQLVIGVVNEFGTIIHIRANTPDDLKDAMHEFLKMEEVEEVRVLAIRNQKL